MRCNNCGGLTDNPKFCSRSCAATKNNHLYPKRSRYSRHRPLRQCTVCNSTFRPCKGAVGEVCSFECTHMHRYKSWAEDVEKRGSFLPVKSTNRCKRFLADKSGHQCQICKRKTWLGKPINLVFDHIDGDSNNWKLKNCRLVCNNCDSTLPTYKGRNKGKGRHMRKQRYKQGKSY
jgi:5-methylcytosine-specific restriction endonuclease McrA